MNKGQKKLSTIQQIKRSLLIVVANKIIGISVEDCSAIFGMTRQGVYNVINGKQFDDKAKKLFT